MRIHRDPVDGAHVIEGYEEFRFSTEADAREASHLCAVYNGEQQLIESRYRRAAERANTKQLETSGCKL